MTLTRQVTHPPLRTQEKITAFFCLAACSRGANDDLFEGIWGETYTISLEKLVLELNPVKTKCVKETFEDIHHQQNSKGCTGEHSKTNEGSKKVNLQSGEHGLLPEHSGKFRVRKRKSPETQVRCCVGNHTKNKLNSLNSLVDDDFSHTVFFLTITMFLIMVVVATCVTA